MGKVVAAKFEYENRITCICGQILLNSNNRIKKHFPWGEVRFIQCHHCGSWCQSPQISLISLIKWFDSPDYQGSISGSGVAYINYITDENHRLVEAKNRYERDLKSDLSSGSRVLEVGCSTGCLLSVLRDHGCEVVGVDLSRKFVEAAKIFYGLDVKLGDLYELDLPKNYFDVIILLGTIGNLQNLPKYLKLFHELLKPNGLLFFNYPEADSPIVKYLYRSRFWMFTPSVDCFMSRKGCIEVLKGSGFQLLSIRPDIQRPSFQKFFNHARLNFLIPPFKRIGIERASLPFALPIPSIKLIKARCIVL